MFYYSVVRCKYTYVVNHINIYYLGLEYVSKDEIRGKLVWYSCSICQVHFDSNLKFAHLVGQKHRINVLVCSDI